MVRTGSANCPPGAPGCAYRKCSSVHSGEDKPQEEEQVPSSHLLASINSLGRGDSHT